MSKPTADDYLTALGICEGSVHFETGAIPCVCDGIIQALVDQRDKLCGIVEDAPWWNIVGPDGSRGIDQLALLAKLREGEAPAMCPHARPVGMLCPRCMWVVPCTQ